MVTSVRVVTAVLSPIGTSPKALIIYERAYSTYGGLPETGASKLSLPKYCLLLPYNFHRGAAIEIRHLFPPA